MTRPIENPVVVPDHYPQTGELDGQTVELREAARTRTRAEMADVVVVIDGEQVRPWRGSDLYVSDDGQILL